MPVEAPPVPEFLAHLPRVGAMVVPIVVTVPADGSTPDFRMLDHEAQLACLERRRCGICGRKIRGDFAFIGPQRELDCFDFPWMHRRCAAYSLAACPWLSERHRERRLGDGVERGSDEAEELLTAHDALPSRIYVTSGAHGDYDERHQVFHFHAGPGGAWVEP